MYDYLAFFGLNFLALAVALVLWYTLPKVGGLNSVHPIKG